MSNSYALVLTGQVLPRVAPETAWSQLAAYLRTEPDKLAQLRARAPLIVKQEENLDRLKGLKDGIAKAGIEAEIFTSDGRPALFVAIEGENRTLGPVPSALIDRRIRGGQWAAEAVRVTESGGGQWRHYVMPGAEDEARPSSSASVSGFSHTATGPAYGPASGWSASSSMSGFGATGRSRSRQPQAAWTTIPAGAAIHAGFWRRCAATYLDWLILFIPLMVVGIIPLLGGIAQLVGPWLYWALMESSESQATLGKRALGIKVVNARGERIGFGRATGRYFSKQVIPLVAGISMAVMIGSMVLSALRGAGASSSGQPDPMAIFNAFSSPAFKTFIMVMIVLGIINLLTYLMVAWTRRKQTLYDMVVGTFVVFDEVEPGAPLPSQRPPMPWYGWVLNVLIVLGMAGMLLIIPMMLKLAREMPAQMTMIPLVSAVESARSQGCQAGKRPLPDRALGTIEVAPGLVGVCRVTLQLADTDQVPEALRGERIELTHGVDGWSCSSRVPAEHLPPHWSCR